MSNHAILIGAQPRASRSPTGERRPPAPAARDHALDPTFASPGAISWERDGSRFPFCRRYRIA